MTELTEAVFECLARFETPGRFEPATHQLPWPMMQALVRDGFMWVERCQSTFWHGPEGAWQARVETTYWAALTPAGQAALAMARTGARHSPEGEAG